MNVRFEGKSLEKFRAKLANFASRIGPAVDELQRQKTIRLLEEVKRNASGRPGPNVVTGRYLAAFAIVEGKVVNPSPQTHRLEYGFVGTDRLGRVYSQPPFPHFRPALAVVAKEFRGEIPKLIVVTWRNS